METKLSMYLKCLVILLAVVSPWIMILVEGPIISISTYWLTSMQPLFIFTNAVTSYFLFSTKNWQIPSTLLLIVTAFSVQAHPTIHNITAIVFFASCVVPIMYSKRLKYYVLLYLCSLFFLFESILYAEICSITVLCAYHAHTLFKYFTVINQRKKFSDRTSNC